MAWKIKIREEDLKHRTVLNTRRRIDDARRSVEEKMEQLKVCFVLFSAQTLYSIVQRVR